jgi:GNAT superfamily N-acetyltransferase
VSIEFRLVDGVSFAEEASRLLIAAWPIPALDYSPAYLRWQLAFPGPRAAPAVAAFVGSTPVGIAASSNRRLRVNSAFHDVLVVSFVAVDPAHRNKGIAGGLYRTLLDAVKNIDAPLITFGRENSSGQRAIERAYPASGLPLRAFGSYIPYATMPRSSSGTDEWTRADAVPPEVLSPVARSAPTVEQYAHYRNDPRPRELLVHRNATAWAWAVRINYVSAKGIETATVLESVCVEQPEALAGLASAAAGLWPSPNPVVNLPNLWGMDPIELRALGFRKTGVPWIGYQAGPPLEVSGAQMDIL